MTTFQIHYEIKLYDGTVLDSSDLYDEPLAVDRENPPFPVTLHERLLALKEGETIEVTLSAIEAYGERQEGLEFIVGRDKLPKDFKPDPGIMISFAVDDDEIMVTVLEADEQTVKLDANHPYSGLDLTFVLTRI